jgi:hypothetical protein
MNSTPTKKEPALAGAGFTTEQLDSAECSSYSETVNSESPSGGHIFTYRDPASADNPAVFDFSAGAPANFPEGALPPLLRTVANDMATVYQTPRCLPAMSALAVLSGAVGSSVVVIGG